MKFDGMVFLEKDGIRGKTAYFVVQMENGARKAFGGRWYRC
jgi:hypothetical protein